MEKKIFLTKEGYEELKEELEVLVKRRRREVAERLKEAKEFGDLMENSEYEDAKNEQAMVEGRIAEISDILARAEIIEDHREKQKVVRIGSVVRLRNQTTGEEAEYRIVSPVESDPLNNKISYESPLGSAVLNKTAGAVIRVDVPTGVIKYEILDVN